VSTAAWRGTPWGPVDDPGELASITADNAASTCGHCSRAGSISLDQRSRSGANGTTGIGNTALSTKLRFHCSCGNEWLVDATEAEAHGRFLTRAGLR
jgi:hypothetical protein